MSKQSKIDYIKKIMIDTRLDKDKIKKNLGIEFDYNINSEEGYKKTLETLQKELKNLIKHQQNKYFRENPDAVKDQLRELKYQKKVELEIYLKSKENLINLDKRIELFNDYLENSKVKNNYEKLPTIMNNEKDSYYIIGFKNDFYYGFKLNIDENFNKKNIDNKIPIENLILYSGKIKNKWKDMISDYKIEDIKHDNYQEDLSMN